MLILPDKIKSLLNDEKYIVDDVGMSASTVILLEDKVLKIQEMSEEAENEYHFMEWLQDKLPVPEILEYQIVEDRAYLLMTKVPGKMACDDEYMNNPEQLTTMLAEGLRMLWKVDVRNCPYIWNLEKKLKQATFAVEHNLVDVNNVEPDTFGENGFKSPHHLLEWLEKNRPDEDDPVFSHGDMCLPNIFAYGSKITGFIDFGRAGIADRWQDIALCYRSLIHNFEGRYNGGHQYKGFSPDMLFEKLGIEPDREKLRYYILLDELF